MQYIILILGFIFLIKGADLFVDGASSLAKRYGVSPLVIGLTIVSFGTGAPEAAISISSAIKGANELTLGNVIGSNIFNLLMVVGVAAVIKTLEVKRTTVRREFPFLILTNTVLLILAGDRFLGGNGEDILSRGDGLILLSFFLIFLYYLAGLMFRNREEMEEVEEEIEVLTLGKSLRLMAMGLAGIWLGGEWVVDSSISIATDFGISQTVIGLTVVAIGTSLPELVISVVASLKGENEIAIGNVVGSNIFNLLFVLGLSASISPIGVETTTLYDMWILWIVAAIVFSFSAANRKIGRIKGVGLLAIYSAYMLYIILR